ncbi:MAG: hypothetical protein LBU58_00840, partial [Clostridiales bacterium]|nr:hypothetical protein [Clostridiales bacterium]
MKRKFAVAFLCLLVSAALTWKLFDEAERTKATVTVLRVTERVEAGTRITDAMLRQAEIGAYGIGDGALTDGAQAVGKYAAADLFPEDTLTAEKFIELDQIADNFVQKARQDHKTAVSIALKGVSASLSGKLKKGDVVSALVFVDQSGTGAQKGYVRSYPELQYLEVAAVANSKAEEIAAGPEAPQQDQTAAKSAGDAAIPASVTFIADESQAVSLVEAENIGNIHLVFRGRGQYGQELLARFEAERAARAANTAQAARAVFSGLEDGAEVFGFVSAADIDVSGRVDMAAD